MCAKIRPQLIPIAEAFMITEIPTNIGNFYGDIYEQQIE